MTDPIGVRAANRLMSLCAVGLVLRLLAALAVEALARHRGTRCLFPDTLIYWDLAGALRRGLPYVVSQWGVPHWTLRVPGYPLFLAACQTLFGDVTLPARLIQAAIGASVIPMLARLVVALRRGSLPDDRPSPARTAALLAAVDPWTVGLSALLLSEALFLPLMMLSLWGCAVLTSASGERHRRVPALATGVAFGAGILVKPSWALFPPLAILAIGIPRRSRSAALLILLGMLVTMAPWWARNARVTGRFVPTALWMGASLYDGWNPRATGASDMRFLEDPEIRSLGEFEQDAELKHRALAFARANPRRVLALAAVKLARFLSPVPNAESLRSPGATAAGVIVTLPIYGLTILGAWDRRRDPRALALSLGPLAYFAVLHVVFVSSVRYRIPAMVPALGLAGYGWATLVNRWRGGGRPSRDK